MADINPNLSGASLDEELPMPAAPGTTDIPTDLDYLHGNLSEDIQGLQPTVTPIDEVGPSGFISGSLPDVQAVAPTEQPSDPLQPQTSPAGQIETFSALFGAGKGYSKAFDLNVPAMEDMSKLTSAGKDIWKPVNPLLNGPKIISGDTGIPEENINVSPNGNIDFNTEGLNPNQIQNISIVQQKTVDKLADRVGDIQTGFTNKNLQTMKLSDLYNVDSGKTYKEQLDEINTKLFNTTQNIMGNSVFQSQFSGLSRNDPTLAIGVQSQILNNLNYLLTNLPKTKSEINIFQKNHSQPTDMEIRDFEQKSQIALNPYHIFTVLGNGTISQNHVDTLRELYPNLYQQFTQKIVEKTADNKWDFAYAARLKLSIMLGVPLDSSIANLGIIQNQFNQQEPQQPKGPMKVTSNKPTTGQSLASNQQ
jgi:hypothetical protein